MVFGQATSERHAANRFDPLEVDGDGNVGDVLPTDGSLLYPKISTGDPSVG